MKVMVTGNEGYLGSVVVDALREAGHDVVGLDTGWVANCLLGPAPEPVPTVRSDIRDVGPHACEGVDAVIHLAALCNDPLGDLNTGATLDINHRATVRLARIAREAGVRRFLFSSSCALYGAKADGELLTEESSFLPLTAYGISKARAEEDLRRLADEHFSPVFLRNGTAYGFSPRMRCDLVVNDLVGQAVLTGEARLHSDGRAWRPLVHVRDIAAAFAAILVAPRERIHGRAFNIGSTAENYQIRHVAGVVAKHVPGSRPVFSADSAHDVRDYRVSCERVATDVPEYRPQWNVVRGVVELAEQYRRHGLTPGDFDGDRYRRLPRVVGLRDKGRLDASLRWNGRSAALDPLRQ
jgi:nucleoside-diphosphate-sugar epimerase